MSATAERTRVEPPPTGERFSDVEYLVYALVQSFKTFLSLAGKRWPHVR